MKHSGFTLLELLIAMAMVGIVALSLFLSLGTAFKARAAADRAVEPSRTAALALDLIAKDIAAAYPPGGSLANTFLGLPDSSGNPPKTPGPMTGTVAGAFEGTDGTDDHGNPGDDLLFFTTAESPNHQEGANGDQKYVELRTVTSQNGNDILLVRKVYNNLLGQTQEDPDTEVICRGVAGFNLRYFDPVISDWVDSWDCSQYSNGLPAAVEITLQLDRPGADGQSRILTFTRVVPVTCSVAYSLLTPSTP